MKRHLIAATTAAALLVPGSAVLADSHEEPVDDTTEETSSLDALADALVELADQLVAGGEEADAEDATEEVQEAFDTFTGALEEALSNFFGELYFAEVEVDALETVEDVEGANGEAVSTLAQCAPRGSFKDLAEGMGNHGEYVTAAAHGETVGLFVPELVVDTGEGEADLLDVDLVDVDTSDVVIEEPELVEFDLTTTEGATSLCEALDVIYQARLLELEVAWESVDSSREARVIAREQCQIERLRAKNGLTDEDAKEICAELRQRVRDELTAERDARRAARDEAKAARDEARAEARAERDAARAERQANKPGKGNGDD